MNWWLAARAVFDAEWALLRGHRKLALAFVGLLFVPAIYAFVYLYAMWDPAAHTRALPAGLVNLDAGARYGERELNLGRDVLAAIEQHGQFAYRRYADPAAARRDVRRGTLAFSLEIPADFSQRALPGEQPGAAKLTIFTSEGNNYGSAGFARRFAPEVAQRVNTMLGEARWDLVLSGAAGSRRNLQTLHAALADLHGGASELGRNLARVRDGEAQLAAGQAAALGSAQRLRGGAGQLSDAAQQMAGGLRQAGAALHTLEARRPPDADLLALRQGVRAQLEAQREMGRGLEALGQGAGRLGAGVAQLRQTADDVPLVGARLVEAIAPLADGVDELGRGLERARAGQHQLQQGAQTLMENVSLLTDGTQRAGQAISAIAARLPEDARVDAFADGAREMVRASDALLGGLHQLDGGAHVLHGGLSRLVDGANRLDTGLELVRRSLPLTVDAPEGSAQGLAASVEPLIEVVAPVPNHGSALTPNFVPLALWGGAVMAAFLVHFRRVSEPLAGLPRSALAAGKLALPMATVLLQALLMLAMLAGVLHVPMPQPGRFALTLALSSIAFLALVWLLVRLLGDLGKVLAVLLLIVQVSAAGALLPIELSDAAFQAVHPYLPLTWVVHAFRASLFGAYDGEFWPELAVVAAIAVLALAIGTWAGRWRPVAPALWRPPLDID